MFIRNDSLLTAVSMIMAPESISTTYLLTESYIENNVIPNLEIEADTASVARWQSIIEQNHQLKENAVFNENLTFNGGPYYEYSQTEEAATTISTEFEKEIDHEFATSAGLEINGIGDTGGALVSFQFTTGRSESTTRTHSTTAGFILHDTDEGDSFSVDLKWDTAYGTPVFDTQSGYSSNPWEENTVPRDAPVLTISPPDATGVLPDEEAIFTISCGNDNQLDESRTYWFGVRNESNEDGAVIELNGNPLIVPIDYLIPHLQTVEGILSIGRNTNVNVYDYNDLEFVLYPAEDEDMGVSATVSVNFQQPASEINIYHPEDNWLVNRSDGDTLEVRLNGYDRFAENLASIELQYRLSTSTREGDKVKDNPILSSSVITESESSISSESKPQKSIIDNEERDGEWFSLAVIPRDSLYGDYKIIYWDIDHEEIVDGSYELRGVTNPISGTAHGYSDIISGMIDRNGPQVLGIPEPVDGILGPDDEIAIHFNENINGDQISQENQDIELFNTVTGVSLDFTFTYGFNTITVEPAGGNEWIENKTFRVDINVLQDMHGNSILETISWEFFVNRNPVEWLGEGIHEVIYIDETVATSRILHNNGGSERHYDIIGGRDNGLPSGEPLSLPDWLEISPIEGILTPGEERSISINLVDNAAAGVHNTTIYASGVMGDEPLIVDIRVLDYPPEWSVNHTQYQYSMNMTATLAVDGILSDDIYDRIGVFVDNEIRGVAELTHIPEFVEHPYEAFITIYSNVEEGEILDFKVWDASESAVLGNISEEYSFSANSVLGNPSSPATITATNQVIKNIGIYAGWNWLSFNLIDSLVVDTLMVDPLVVDTLGMEINSYLESLSPVSSDLIKDHVSFSMYYPGFGWAGPLSYINTSTMYLMNMCNADTLEITGYPVNVETNTIFVENGWNWISYLPQYSMQLNYALNSLDSLTTGDVIKSQTAFAQYVDMMGWFGNMPFMEPDKGYLIKLTYDGELVYPFEVVPLTGKPDQDEKCVLVTASDPGNERDNYTVWQSDHHLYQSSMNVVGVVCLQESESISETIQIGAFCGNECRGAANSVYVPEFERSFVFLTIYGEPDESTEITFRYYDSESNQTVEIDESITFQVNEVVGSILDPYIFNIGALTGDNDNEIIATETKLQHLYPNPFNPQLHLSYSLKQDSPVVIAIYNIKGQLVTTLVDEIQPQGYHDLVWNADNQKGNQVASGIYFLKMTAPDYKEMRKVLLMK